MNLCTSLSTLRSCVTDGESWVFFIFDAADSGEGGTVSISEEFCLGDDDDDLSGLSLVLGSSANLGPSSVDYSRLQ